MVHVQAVGDVAAVVEGDLAALGGGGGGEGDGKGGAVGGEGFGGEDDIGGALVGVGAGEVRGHVVFDAELGDVVFAGDLVGHGRQQRHLHRVGAGDHEGAVEEEDGDGVVEAGDAGEGAGRPALAVGLGRVVDQHGFGGGGGGGDAEALGAFVAAVEPDDGAVGEEGAFDHAAAFGHRVHFPGRVGGVGLDAAAARVGGGCDVLVGAAAADDDVCGVLVRA